MKSRALLLLSAVLALFRAVSPAADDALSLQKSFVEAARRVSPAVVTIQTKQRGHRDPLMDYLFGPRDSSLVDGVGSGVVIESNGTILTNEHVVRNAELIEVTLSDGRKLEAVIMGKDPRRDLAVIRVDVEDLPAAPLGDSNSLEVGQWAVAIGNPFLPYGISVSNPHPSVTVGVISALHRTFEDQPYVDLIQTDASINTGSSGGPLLNLEGEVVGINTAIFSPTVRNIGIGFAIPVNQAKEVLSDLMEGNRVKYGWLGVHVRELKGAGALVAGVIPGSPAEGAGLEKGDVIQSFNGWAVRSPGDLVVYLKGSRTGTVADLVVERSGRPHRVKVNVGETPPEKELGD